MALSGVPNFGTDPFAKARVPGEPCDLQATPESRGRGSRGAGGCTGHGSPVFYAKSTGRSLSAGASRSWWFKVQTAVGLKD